MLKPFLKTYRFSLGWSFIILLLCALPGATIRKLRLEDLFSLDKLIHAILFLVLCLLLVKESRAITIKAKVAIAIFAIVYGGLLEIMQSVAFSGRAGDVLDFIANSVGAIVGIGLTHFIFTFHSKQS